MGNPVPQGRHGAREAASLLADGQYAEAAASYERTLPGYDAPEVRLGLSYAYLALRDGQRAERQARSALAAAPSDLQPAAWAQLGRVLAFQGHYDEALYAWDAAQEAAANYKGVQPIEADARSSLWHAAMLNWARGDLQAARPMLETLQDGDDIYALSARVKLAQLLAPTDSDISQKLTATAERDLKAGMAQRGAAIPDLRVPGAGEG